MSGLGAHKERPYEGIGGFVSITIFPSLFPLPVGEGFWCMGWIFDESMRRDPSNAMVVEDYCFAITNTDCNGFNSSLTLVILIPSIFEYSVLVELISPV